MTISRISRRDALACTAAAGLVTIVPRRVLGGPQHIPWANYLTAAVLLGNIAIRTGKTLDWDPQQRRFTNYEPANKLLSEPSRSGWALG